MRVNAARCERQVFASPPLKAVTRWDVLAAGRGGGAAGRANSVAQPNKMDRADSRTGVILIRDDMKKDLRQNHQLSEVSIRTRSVLRDPSWRVRIVSVVTNG